MLNINKNELNLIFLLSIIVGKLTFTRNSEKNLKNKCFLLDYKAI